MYLADSPIKLQSEDRLDRSNFVKRISQTITEWKVNDSLVIAIHGPWGYGKSSILNLLAEEINNSNIKSIKVTMFDLWFFNSLESILESFLETFYALGTKLISDEEEKKSLQVSLQKYTKKLSFSNVNISLNPEISVGPIKIKIPLEKKPEQEDLETIKAKLQSSLSKIKGRIVVLIDNLDRLDINELLLMLKLVRLCNDFPNITYVLAFDRKQVERLLQQEKSIDSDYLEKIIQVDINLPKIDDIQIDNFLNESINEIFNRHQIILEENFRSRFAPVFQDYMKLILNNFRATKRYINALSFSLPLLKDEVNYADFFILEFLRVFFPLVYAEIQLYESDFLSVFPGVANDWQTNKLTSSYTELVNWINYNNPEDADLIQHAIAAMFPTFESYILKPTNPGYYTDQSQNDKELRICSPNHYEKYFRLQLPSKEVSNALVKKLIIQLNAPFTEPQAKEIITILLQLVEDNKLTRLCRKLNYDINSFTNQGVSNLLDLFAGISDLLKWESTGSFEVSEVRVVSFLLIDALFSIKEPQEFLSQFSRFINTCNSLSFAADFSLFLFLSIDKGKYELDKSIDRAKLKFPIITRVKDEVINSNLDVVKEYPSSFMNILAIWKDHEFIAKPEKANDYLYSNLEETPIHLLRVLGNFMWVNAGTREPSDLEYRKLKEKYDVEKLYEIGRKINLTDQLSETEKFILNKFKQLYKQEKDNV
mgnify:CR=1 FL=1